MRQKKYWDGVQVQMNLPRRFVGRNLENIPVLAKDMCCFLNKDTALPACSLMIFNINVHNCDVKNKKVCT